MAGACIIQKLANLAQQNRRCSRLLDEAKRSGGQRPRRQRPIRFPAQHDHRCVMVQPAKQADELEAVHARQVIITHDQGNRLPFEHSQTTGRIPGFQHEQTLAAQVFRQCLLPGRVIVDQQDVRHHVHERHLDNRPSCTVV